NVGGLTGGSRFGQAQCGVVAGGAALVDEVDPGEVIHVPVLAGDQETSGQGRRLPLARSTAICVDVLGLLGPVEVGPQLEEAAGGGRQLIAPLPRAAQPPGEQADRYAGSGPVAVRVGRVLRQVRRGAQGGDGAAEAAAHGGQEAVLGQDTG